MNPRWFVGDVETSGVTPDDGVVELAWIEIDDDLRVLDTRHSMIDPQCQISASASGVHGITNKDVEDAPTLDEYFGVVIPNHFYQDDQVVLIAHNAEFDRRFLKAHIPIVDVLCTLRLARKIWPSAENHKLQTLMYELGLTRGKSHSADGDVETCLDLLHKIVDATGKTLPELAAESMEPIWVATMPFGTHKGKPLKTLGSYITWALKNLSNLDRDLRHSMELVKAGKAP